MPDLKGHAARAARYGLAGLINTALGLLVIYALDLGLHVAPQVANAAGYILGAGVGYALNKVFVFRSAARVSATGPRYLAVILAAFIVNQAVLKLVLTALPSGPLQHAVGQLAGMTAYTAFAFAACQFWVFRSPGRTL
jgi:putative flippase GtrA